MPSTSEAQHRLMEAAEHDPDVRRRTGISRQTAHDFTSADQKDNAWKQRERAKTVKAGCSEEIYNLLMKA